MVRVRISLLLELFVLLGLLEGSILSPDQDCGVLVFVFSFVFVLFSFWFDNPVRFVFSFGFDNPVVLQGTTNFDLKRPPWSILFWPAWSLGFVPICPGSVLVVRVVSSSGSFYHSGECDSGVSLGVSIGGLGSPNDTSGSKRSSCWMTGGGIVLVRPSF